MKKDVRRNEFESYASRILSLSEICNESYDELNKSKKVTQMRFQIKNTEMKMISIKKKQFSEVNDKRCYMPDGTFSLPHWHSSLNKTREMEKIVKGT